MSSTPNTSTDRPSFVPKHALSVFSTDQGNCYDTGSKPETTAYLVTLWTGDALSDDTIQSWQAEKKDILAEMALAGQKGSYGKLAGLSDQLKNLFQSRIEETLTQSNASLMSDEAMREIADSWANNPHCDLHLCGVFNNHLHLLLSINGEQGLDSLISEWLGNQDASAWSPLYYTEAFLAPQYYAYNRAIKEEVAKGKPRQSEQDASQADTPTEEIDFHHITVLLNETVDLVQAGPGKLIIDCTLGGGGHTRKMLEKGATVWGIDQDAEARCAASAKLAQFGDRFKAIAGNFSDIKQLLADEGVSQVDGIIADLGISSHQVDKAERGFSFRENGPLDMRMDTSARFSAEDLINNYDEKDIADIIWQYGEERASRAIARAIVKARSNSRITTTGQLASIIESVLPRKGKQHPATRSFQALRIAVNDELGALDRLLEDSASLLAPQGRLAIITFHSLEDRRVKQYFDLCSRPEIDRPEWPEPKPNPLYYFKNLTKKPIIATDQEIHDNPRSRSAKLRGVERI